MQPSVDYLNSKMNVDFKDLLNRKRAMESNPAVQSYLALLDEIKAEKDEIGKDMLALYRAHGIQSVESDIATAYVKSECEIMRDRLTPAQIVAMFDYNPSAFKVTDKAVRDSIKLAQLAKANGDVSEGVDCLLAIDMDRLRGPVKHTAVVRVASTAGRD